MNQALGGSMSIIVLCIFVFGGIFLLIVTLRAMTELAWIALFRPKFIISMVGGFGFVVLLLFSLLRTYPGALALFTAMCAAPLLTRATCDWLAWRFDGCPDLSRLPADENDVNASAVVAPGISAVNNGARHTRPSNALIWLGSNYLIRARRAQQRANYAPPGY